MIILESQKYKLGGFHFSLLKDRLHEWLCCVVSSKKGNFQQTHFFLRLYQNDLLFFIKIFFCQITIY